MNTQDNIFNKNETICIMLLMVDQQENVYTNMQEMEMQSKIFIAMLQWQDTFVLFSEAQNFSRIQSIFSLLPGQIQLLKFFFVSQIHVLQLRLFKDRFLHSVIHKDCLKGLPYSKELETKVYYRSSLVAYWLGFQVFTAVAPV